MFSCEIDELISALSGNKDDIHLKWSLYERQYFTVRRCTFFLGCMFTCVCKSKITSSNNSKFEPVKWRITQITGGFPINNETSKSYFVQVVLSHGAVATHKKALNHASDCEAYLSDASIIKSIICELAPSETLYIDKEFADPVDATGTYQIAIIN